jgi:hypothetical protein
MVQLPIFRTEPNNGTILDKLGYINIRVKKAHGPLFFELNDFLNKDKLTRVPVLIFERKISSISLFSFSSNFFESAIYFILTF